MEVEIMHKKSTDRNKKKKNKNQDKNSRTALDSRGVVEAVEVPLIKCSTTTTTTDNDNTNVEDNSKIKSSMFDYCYENHLKAMDMIYKICGEEDDLDLVDCEIERLASTITFLSEWRYFKYNSRSIRFVSETGHPNEMGEIALSQFSAAMVPKYDKETEKLADPMSTDSCNDFVLYVGGLVWSLDWCPRMDQGTNSAAQCEFIAVAAHPPDSKHHKIGDPLSGRGMIQIWCLLNSTTKEGMLAPVESIKRRYQKNKAAKNDENKPVRPRGRPKKNVLRKPPASNSEGQISQALVLRPSVNTLEVSLADEFQEQIAPEVQIAHHLAVKLPVNTSDMPHAAQEMSSPGSKNDELHQSKNLSKEESKQEQPRGKARKNRINNISVEDPEGQFIPALAVQLPGHTLDVLPVDENIISVSAPKKRKERKRKAANNEKNATARTAGSSEGQFIQALATEFPEGMKKFSPTGDNLLNTSGPLEETKKCRTSERLLAADMDCTLAVLKRRSRNKSKAFNELDRENNGYPTQILDPAPSLATVSLEKNIMHKNNLVSEEDMRENTSNLGSDCGHVLNDVLPRVVLCLGHDGKVAWDVKWRPLIDTESVAKHRMGYLAVVLGNGSVEVWEIPSPKVISSIYASRRAKDTDPRFAKLKPVFRCSMLKYGDRQSMPLTVEWSTTPPHDLILAGCHDGVVALWKFSANASPEDSRPLLCFSAETGPIRALTWAPYEGDPESSNIIVTAGHGGLKFWDLRDPFRPLWDAIPSQRFIYGLDWAPDPRCVLVTYDDGTLRMLSLSRAACDVPVTGRPFSGTQQQGVHSYYLSSFAVWRIHVSRLTGMVAYCCTDGTVLYFQLTHKQVDKDPLRNRAPHFLCGSLASEDPLRKRAPEFLNGSLANDEPTVIMNTQLPSSPHRIKKSATEWTNAPRSARTVASDLNQAKRVRKGTEKTQKPDDQLPALCYGDDTRNADTNELQTSAKGGKNKTSKSEKTNDDQALICSDGNEENSNNKADPKGEAGRIIEVPPPKIVSMYSVRWNMNKGSERWLCYGGAAGIVRCQEIVAPVFDKKLLKW
ncbi:uncharacterized protein LOC130813150 [Amaranthus tricolor]|uniref:uncharacterized protein LOC130813150 n=1 Tax=Amaranthus tricolor TaxID=29722 RepID=UPI002590C786|nr:uncharacterized protein LOC130813150 [Amaranthus tricolor]